MDLTEGEDIKKRWQNTQNCIFSVFSFNIAKTGWINLKSTGNSQKWYGPNRSRRGGKNTQNYTKKGFNYLDNHDDVITHLELVIPECEVKWALGSNTMNKASGGDRISVELFQILKDDAVKVLHSICQKIPKTQQWPQVGKRSVFIPIPNKGNVK